VAVHGLSEKSQGCFIILVYGGVLYISLLYIYNYIYVCVRLCIYFYIFIKYSIVGQSTFDPEPCFLLRTSKPART